MRPCAGDLAEGLRSSSATHLRRNSDTTTPFGRLWGRHELDDVRMGDLPTSWIGRALGTAEEPSADVSVETQRTQRHRGSTGR